MSDYFLVNITSGRWSKQFAKISPQDAELVLLHKWRAATIKRRGTVYAISAEKEAGKYSRLRMHRLIMGVTDEQHVDHINGDGLDNRRENLRIATPQQNQGNSQKRAAAQSRYKGVSWSVQARKWRAYITLNRKQTHLGLFADEIDAARAYDAKAIELFGGFARTNI